MRVTIDKTSISNSDSNAYYYTVSRASNGKEAEQVYRSRTTIMDRVLWRDDAFEVSDPHQSGYSIEIHQKRSSGQEPASLFDRIELPAIASIRDRFLTNDSHQLELTSSETNTTYFLNVKWTTEEFLRAKKERVAQSKI